MTPNTNLALVTRPHAESGQTEFWLSQPERIEDGDGDWGFSVYVDKDVFLATFAYGTQADALKASIAMVQVLQGAVFIATAES